MSHSNSEKCPHCQSEPCCCTNIQIENNPTNTNTNTVNPVFNINVTTPECPPTQDGICPPPTLPNEPPECEQRRQQIGGDVFDASNGWQFGFINALQDYPAILDPTNVNSCFGTFGGGWHLASYEELLVLAMINDISDLALCPTLIWTTFGGFPTLAYIIPESETIVVVPTPSIFCPAYSICVNTGG